MRAFTIFIVATVLTHLAGCAPGGPADRDTKDGIWVVEDSGEIEGGAQLLMMEHGEWEDTGEFAAFDTYGQPIRDGDETAFLLWTNSPTNPFSLQPGDRFRFASSIDERYFDEDRNGYHALVEDIEVVRN